MSLYFSGRIKNIFTINIVKEISAGNFARNFLRQVSCSHLLSNAGPELENKLDNKWKIFLKPGVGFFHRQFAYIDVNQEKHPTYALGLLRVAKNKFYEDSVLSQDPSPKLSPLN